MTIPIEGVQGLLAVGVPVGVETEDSRRRVGGCPAPISPALLANLRVEVLAGQQFGQNPEGGAVRMLVGDSGHGLAAEMDWEGSGHEGLARGHRISR